MIALDTNVLVRFLVEDDRPVNGRPGSSAAVKSEPLFVLSSSPWPGSDRARVQTDLLSVPQARGRDTSPYVLRRSVRTRGWKRGRDF